MLLLLSLSVVFAQRIYQLSRNAETRKATFLLIKELIPSHLVINKLFSSEWHYRYVHIHHAFSCILSLFHVNTDEGLLFVAGQPEKSKFMRKIEASFNRC